MKGKFFLLSAIFCLSNQSFPSTTVATYATKEYVNQQDQAVKSSLQNEIKNLPKPISYSAGEGIEIISNVISTKKSQEFKIGDFYQGGIIFWLDPTQKYQHGLIVDLYDLPGKYKWDSSSKFISTSATKDEAYSGKENTAKIIALLSTRGEAAFACGNSTSGGYRDWYLPSSTEITTLFANKMTINQIAKIHNGGEIARTAYWISMEEQSGANFDRAYKVVSTNTDYSSDYKNNQWNVRCIRAF